MTTQQINLPANKRYKYDCVLTSKMKPDARFNCNRIVGQKRVQSLPAKATDSNAVKTKQNELQSTQSSSNQ